MRNCAYRLSVVFALASFGPPGSGQDKSATNPSREVYAHRGNAELAAYVFKPQGNPTGPPRAAIVLFHGGGWDMGEPSWAFGRAQHFADRGLIAVAVQYRLSDQKEITPADAVEDARTAIRWVRSQARELGVDPKRIAAYGWSAGAHLAASTAVFDAGAADATGSCAPDALVLVSPAVSVASSAWFQRLLGSKGEARELSPAEHVRSGLPPTVIVTGRQDTVTPLAGIQAFAERMKAAGNRCELHVYDGVGHLFTPVGTPDDGYPRPDTAVQSAGYAELDAFLVSLGYMK